MEVIDQRHIPAVFYPPGMDLCIGGWESPRVGLDAEAKRKVFCRCWGSNSSSPVYSDSFTIWLSSPDFLLLFLLPQIFSFSGTSPLYQLLISQEYTYTFTFFLSVVTTDKIVWNCIINVEQRILPQEIWETHACGRMISPRRFRQCTEELFHSVSSRDVRRLCPEEQSWFKSSHLPGVRVIVEILHTQQHDKGASPCAHFRLRAADF